MCGIAGGIGLNPGTRPDPVIVATMSGLLAHRGPDGEGMWTSPSGRACLAHRRLSVIDPSMGQQPMLTRSGNGAIVFNGEIYNYVELRAGLARQGETFLTSSDTEVLLRLIEREGASCLERLRGMFAFLAWDDQKGTLLAARDRLGKKPFYYREYKGCVYFASSIGALRHSLGSGPWQIDPGALDDLLTLGYIPAPATIYSSTFKLPASTLIRLDHSRLQEEKFWDLAADIAPFRGTYDDALGQLQGLLETAVSIRLRSDVPLGVFLSGGIDSSLVAATASKCSPHRIETFAVGFEESAYDESSHAKAIAKHIGTRHHAIRVRDDLIELLPEVIPHFGEPMADASALPTWILSRFARTQVTVALGGDGGDEAFGGYDWYGNAERLGVLAKRVPLSVARSSAWMVDFVQQFAQAPALGRVARGLSMLAIPSDSRRFAALRSFLTPPEARRVYSGPLKERHNFGRTGPDLLHRYYEAAAGSPLRRMRYADIKSYLANDLMPKIDVASMAHGLEVRAPLLDQEIVRFGLSLPDDYLRDKRGGKRILRDLLASHVPEKLFARSKQGFSVPLGNWFRGRLRPRLETLIEQGPIRDLGLLDPIALRKMLDDHCAGRRDRSQQLYSLLVLDQWLNLA
jgi:asparagine synthase (glutamine-hydrolysing)